MVGLDEGALTCDFAETYHVLDWRALPARTAATLAMGLGPDSRIMQKISGARVPLDTLLLAMIADVVRILAWMQTKDGVKGRNRPASILENLTGTGQDDEAASFDSPEAFDAWRASILEGFTNE
mgnify:CR=1 FL=1